ncbi:Omp28-related outer membrane protein [Aureivirga sp. CE67]|uniref:Omp28-related outer membrane protein n=1 Tax=Aureivirga sp. CE67 TaxID=1788983 RepID=UPI0018C9A7C1|nr:Omp28-related outer membrane protein [Aureivirga sp. CE67]
MKKFIPNLTKIISCLFLLLIVSCDEEEPQEYLEYILSTDKDQINLNSGESFNFTVASEYGDDLTDNSVYFINGEEISGKTYTPTEVGTYNAYAKYEGLSTQTIQLNVTEELPTSFTQKITIEEFTGTWCGYCVDMGYKLYNAIENNSNIIPIVIHGRGGDVMTYERLTDIEEFHGIEPGTGYPRAYVNRGDSWLKTEEELQGPLNQTPKLGLAINSSLEDNNISIDVKVAFAENVSDTKIVVYLMENNLIYSQTNYSSYYDGQNPIPNYEHNDVMRKSLTDLFGDDMEPQSVGDLFVKQFNQAVPGSIENPENMSIVAFVVDSNNKVINAQSAKIGENKVFD